MILLEYFLKILISFSFMINQLNAIIEQQPIFTSQPVDVGPLFSGTRGILQCTASGTPTVQYRWLKDNHIIQNKSTSNGGVYLIGQADRSKDVGVYQCIAENTLGSVLSNKAQLTIAYMEQLKVQYRTEIRVKYGHAAIIKMPKMFDAYPQPTIEWFAGGALIEPNAKFAITKDFNLVVLRCDKADEKSYYVEASSIHTGTKIRSREIRLFVVEPQQHSSNSFNNYLTNNQDDFQDEEYNSNQNEDLNSNDQTVDLEFVVKPTDTIAKLNDNLVKFDCIVNSRKQPLDQLEINWYKDDQLIDFIKTKYHLSSRSLEIISVTDQDAGTYTCAAKYTTTSQQNLITSINASAKLDVYIKPTFITQPENVIETDFGKTVQLKCDGISNPKANITWYKNAQLIDFEKHKNIHLNDSNTKLVINNISQKDQAIYQCFLSNQAGHISASTLIKIISFAPKFTETMVNRTVYSDSNIALSCGKVDGSPKPRITWIKMKISLIDSKYQSSSSSDDSSYLNNNEGNNNNNNIDENENINYNSNIQEEQLVSAPNGDLIIKNANIKHQGWYKCEATNLLGTISANMYLQIKKKTEIIEPPMNISVTKGQSALFKCTVSKEDEIDVDLKWKFNDLILDLPVFKQQQFYNYNNNYNMDMSYSAENNQNSNLRLYPNGTLQILEAKNTDIGTYKCIVRSTNNYLAGNDTKIAYLNVVELPYAPINLKSYLNLNEKRSANLTWQSSFDGNSQIIKYIIHARVTGFDTSLMQYDQLSNLHDWFVIKDNVFDWIPFQMRQSTQQQSTTHWSIINDLKPAFSYEFRVSAVNGIGEGMPSRPSNNITIPEEAPSQPPLNIQAYSINSKVINLQWQPPIYTSWNGRLKGYKIAYSLSYPNSTWKYLTVNDKQRQNVNLTDLIVWETYLIRICAFNSVGLGKFSDPPIRVRTKEGIPIRAPINFRANSINSTCIRMSWSEPPAQFVNGIIQGYKLIYYENNKLNVNNKSETLTINLNSLNQTNSNSYTTTTPSIINDNQYFYQMCNLSKFTLYTLSILCFTNSGDGPTTQPIQLKTFEDIPGEVSNIKFVNVYDTSIEMEWESPAQPNGRILSYIISYSLLKPSMLNTTSTIKFDHVILDSSQNNFTLRNLKSSTEYVIGIRAKTQAGDGIQKLTQIKSGVPPELPEPPKIVFVRTIGNNWCEIEFIPGYNGKTSISKWIIEAYELSKYDNEDILFDKTASIINKWKLIDEITNAPNATRLIVKNLKPFTNYTLRMYSQNIKGICKYASKPTDIFQTLADVPSMTPEYLTARMSGTYKNTTKENDINVLVKWSPIITSKWNGIPLGYVLSINDCYNKSKNSNRTIQIDYNKFGPNHYMINNLQAFKCYTICIAALNNVGLGQWTPNERMLIINRTSQAKPSRSPLTINLYSINSTTIRVTWTKQQSYNDVTIESYLNGILVGYKIKYQPVDLTNSPFINKLLNNSYFTYFYYDDNSVSSASNSNSQSDQFDLNDQNNDITLMNNFRVKEVLIYNKNQYEIQLFNLLSNTNYKIEISMCTRSGCGQPSLPVSLRTSEYLPSKPIDLIFSYVNLTSVRLEWKAPIYSNGQIKSYRIRYILKRFLINPSTNENKNNLVDLVDTGMYEWSTVYVNVNKTNSNETNYICNINDLAKMEYYLFEISANNTANMGWGEPARTLVYTIDTYRRLRPDPPSKPSISKSSIKSNEVTISWNTNSDNYSPIRYFTVQIKEIKKRKTTKMTLINHINKNIQENNTQPKLNENWRDNSNSNDIDNNDFDEYTYNWRTIYIIKTSSNLNTNYRLTIRGKDKYGNQMLKPNGNQYKFRISSTNDVGTSDFSLESNLISTKHERPNKLALSFSIKPINDQKIEMKWFELINLIDETENDCLTKYKIVYKMIITNEYVNQNLEALNNDLNEITIDYKNTTKLLINSTNFDSEMNLLDDIVGSDFKEMKRNVYKNDMGIIRHSFIVDINNYLIDMINTTYEFSICPTNAIGESSRCTPAKSLAYMNDREPSTVQNLIKLIESLSSTELNVSWHMPTSQMINGKLYAFKLTYFSIDLLDDVYLIEPLLNKRTKFSFMTSSLSSTYQNQEESENENSLINNDLINTIIIEPFKTNVILSNLRPFKNYTVLLQIINQCCESNIAIDSKKLLVAQTQQSIPERPSKLSFSYVSYNFLNVTWFRPEKPNGIILAYELWYENLPSNSSISSNNNIKIIRQEIATSNLNSNNNLTVYIPNLEASVEYKFKIRCRTQINWGPYIERTIKTGPQLIIAKNGLIGSPLAPSKPMYSNINDTHAMLEWKAYSSSDYELFIIEVKFISLIQQTNKTLHPTSQVYEFEMFGYSRQPSLIINKYDKKLNQRLSSLNIATSTPTNAGESLGISSNVKLPLPLTTLCVFRVFSFNSVSISEPSQNSDLIHIIRSANNIMLFASSSSSQSSQPISSYLDSANKSVYLNQFYLNWWFLVIVALSSVTILIIIILIMFLRGKNKKFLMQKKKRMNTIRMMKLNQNNMNPNGQQIVDINQQLANGAIIQNSVLLDGTNVELDSDNVDSQNISPDHLISNSNNQNIYLHGSNAQLILTNATNSLSRNSNYNLYEIRKSKRGGNQPTTPNYNTGTIKTATYVSPNGTLSKVNIISSDTFQQQSTINSTINNNSQMINSMTLLKQQQLNGLNNPRNLSNLIGTGMHHSSLAQPNEYLPSGRIGAIVANSEANRSFHNLNHYLMPLNSHQQDQSKTDLNNLNLYIKPQQLINDSNNFVQAKNLNTKNNNIGVNGGGIPNVNFNYSSSDTDNESSSNSTGANLINSHSSRHNQQSVFDRNTLHSSSIRQSNIYSGQIVNNTNTISSFGRKPQANMSQSNQLPPPHPSLLNNDLAISQNQHNQEQLSTFDDRRNMINYASIHNKRVLNAYYDHQQVAASINPTEQPTYHTHQSLPPPPPPLPPQVLPPQLPTSNNSKSSSIPLIISNPIQYNSKSPYILKKTNNSSITNAVSNTVEALGALNNYAAQSSISKQIKPPPQPPVIPTQQHQQQPIQLQSSPTNVDPEPSNENNSSINFNGDRIMMNNTAGSRRPLTGYSSFN